ncbi:MAG: cytochrome c [Bacteroidia bacterium]|nr:cytochrome c [Bacteroidia bacterium]
MQLIKTFFLGAAATVILAGCTASGDNPGKEFAPNMYHAVPYEPLSQITDENAGNIVNSLDSRSGEYFNSNKYNPSRMTMREPPPHTVRRSPFGFLPYRMPNDTVGLRKANSLVSPFETTKEIIGEGKILYGYYCQHCHGAKGAGDGKVSDKYAGVANLTGDAYKTITEGHIFHVITYGKGLMGAHGSQVSQEDRWKIAKYVKDLQKN